MDLVRVRGYDVARAARDLGVPVATLNMWLKKAGWVRPAEGTVDPEDGVTPPSQDPARLRARVSELERQVKRLEMEKEILKKATAFFASQGM
jgi:transposase